MNHTKDYKGVQRNINTNLAVLFNLATLTIIIQGGI